MATSTEDSMHINVCEQSSSTLELSHFMASSPGFTSTSTGLSTHSDLNNLTEDNNVKSCSLCSYKTTNSSHMRLHIRTHSGDKPFACHLCPHRCNQKSNLQSHLLTHTGEKPFQCSFCDYRSTRKGNVKMHEVNKHADQLNL